MSRLLAGGLSGPCRSTTDFSHRADLAALAVALLRDGGVAVDDFCSRVWKAAEIETDTVFSGSRFGEDHVR